MKKLNLTALLLGAALFTGLGITSASAENMKCGTGKCGSSAEKSVRTIEKCDCEKKAAKCDCKEKASMKAAKCGTGKCGDAEPATKCGSKK